MRASHRPACPETPLYLDLPRENAALFLLTYAIISSCRTNVSIDETCSKHASVNQMHGQVHTSMIELRVTASASQACMAACRVQASVREAIKWWSVTAEGGSRMLLILSKGRLHLGADRPADKYVVPSQQRITCACRNTCSSLMANHPSSSSSKSSRSRSRSSSSKSSRSSISSSSSSSSRSSRKAAAAAEAAEKQQQQHQQQQKVSGPYSGATGSLLQLLGI